jgi:hypothetical protein
MKTSELIGPALDWAVAKCEGYDEHEWDHEVSNMWLIRRSTQTEHWLIDYFQPSTDWSQGGAIIEREDLAIGHANSGEAPENRFGASKIGIHPWAIEAGGPTKLIAAMRCYIASKVGDEIEIPKELI